MPNAPRHTNRLVHESSPYLLQHAHNPVDWYPWGEAAFAKARAEDKPILLSVGYASCHWCHVMERESFEDEAIARLLAEGFVAIKVDREELPDVDHVYMSALQALTGSGGWPMNLFLTPALAPFHGGTYFPPQARHGLPGFADVLLAVREAWTTRRADLDRQASTLLARVRAGVAVASGRAEPGLHERALAQLAQRFDPANGGFGQAPKFPQAPLLQYLLSLAALGHEQASSMLTRTLLQMTAGGLYDHVGGGFARYSTDAHWSVPHFEKMLVDNAQLARVYVGAYRLTCSTRSGSSPSPESANPALGTAPTPELDGEPRLRFIAEDTLAWLLREMHPADAAAAFSSAQDADAEDVEGRFHVWTALEFRAVLGDDAALAARLYGVTESGNWGHGGEPGVNVLQRRDPDSVRTSLGLSPEAWTRWEHSVRERLYAARAQRIRPLTDDKVLADGNGMALRAFAEAGRLLGRDDVVQTARKLAHFLLQTMQLNGRLRHAWRGGVLRSEGYLADYAQVGLGLVELHAATGELTWLAAAHGLCESMVERFHVDGEGFYDSEPGPLPLRSRERFDGAVPSGTAAACELLLRLAGVFDNGTWIDLAWHEIERNGSILELPMAAPALLHAQLYAEHGGELALPTADGTLGTLAAARAEFAPLLTLVSGPPDAVPALAGRTPGSAYLCQHGRCQLPAGTLAELRAQLARLHTR